MQSKFLDTRLWWLLVWVVDFKGLFKQNHLSAIWVNLWYTFTHSAVRVELVSTPELNFGVKSFQVLTPECSIPIQQLFNTDPLWCWISVDTGNTQYQFNNYSTQSLFCVESVLTPRSVQPGLNWCQHFLYLLLNMHLCPWFLTTSVAQSVKAQPKKIRLTPVQHRFNTTTQEDQIDTNSTPS